MYKELSHIRSKRGNLKNRHVPYANVTSLILKQRIHSFQYKIEPVINSHYLIIKENQKISCAHFISVSAKATYSAISKTYGYLTPDFWEDRAFSRSPYQEYTDFLAKTQVKPQVPKSDRPY